MNLLTWLGALVIPLEYEICDQSKDLDLDVSNVTVYFYDFPNNIVKSYLIKEAAQNILSYPNLDNQNKFFVFIPGSTSDIKGNPVQRVKKTFKKVLPNCYLIIVDYFDYNDRNGKDYIHAVKYAYYIGKQFAQVLAGMYRGGISSKNMHCIGFSLGAQILGNIGYEFTQITKAKIERITALDPAGPCYSSESVEDQVRSGLAEYVEIYHSNAGGYGTTSLLGDTDFIVNNGRLQPNCLTKDFNCNHEYCLLTWLASVGSPDRYPAYKCDTYINFKAKNCQDNSKTLAGFYNPGNATGVYYFSTEGYNVHKILSVSAITSLANNILV